MIDTHAHIYLDQFEEDLNEIIARSKSAGVSQILMPNIDHDSLEKMLQVEKQYPSYCRSMIGLHPCDVKEGWEKEMAWIEDSLKDHNFIAIGEIGTDLYWDKTFFQQQKEAFNYQCRIALRENLPIVIHCRDSIDETIELVEAFSSEGLRGVFHCFTGNVEQAQRIISLGFYLGIGGVATFKKGGLDKVIPYIDPKYLVVETDSPYLAPTPHRGKRNEPAYVRLVLEKLSLFYGMPMEELDQQTTSNSRKLFDL